MHYKKLIINHILTFLKPLIEELVKREIRMIEENYRHNYWLIELSYARLMKKIQEDKCIESNTLYCHISKNNPFVKVEGGKITETQGHTLKDIYEKLREL